MSNGFWFQWLKTSNEIFQIVAIYFILLNPKQNVSIFPSCVEIEVLTNIKNLLAKVLNIIEKIVLYKNEKGIVVLDKYCLCDAILINT